MNTPINDFASVREQRERELKTMTAEELHIRLTEDLAHTKDLEASLATAKRMEVQTREILLELIIEAGGAVVYFPDLGGANRDGVLLMVTTAHGFTQDTIVLNPKSATHNWVAPVEKATDPAQGQTSTDMHAVPMTRKKFRKVSRAQQIEEAERLANADEEKTTGE